DLTDSFVQAFAASDAALSGTMTDSGRALIEDFNAAIRERIPGAGEGAVNFLIDVLVQKAQDVAQAGQQVGEAVSEGVGAGVKTLGERLREGFVGIDEMFADITTKKITLDEAIKDPTATEAYLQNIVNLNDEVKLNAQLMGEVKDATVRAHAAWL